MLLSDVVKMILSKSYKTTSQKKLAAAAGNFIVWTDVSKH